MKFCVLWFFVNFCGPIVVRDSSIHPLYPHFHTICSFSANCRINLSLGEGVNVAVGVYATAVVARKPGSIKLYRETNEPVRSKTRMFHTQTGSLLLPSEIKKSLVSGNTFYSAPVILFRNLLCFLICVSVFLLQTYGNRQIVMEKDEVDSIKKFEDPGLYLIGFKPMEKLELQHHIRPAAFIYPEEGEVKGSTCLSVCFKLIIRLLTQEGNNTSKY